MNTDVFLVLLCSVISVGLGEFFSWLFVYRTSSYKTLKARIDFSTSKLEKNKEAVDQSSAKKSKSSKQRKASRLEEGLQADNGKMMLVKFKSVAFVGVMMLFVMSTLRKYLQLNGKVVAKLPFVPLSIFRRISHRGLPGTDFTDSSFTFVYILGSMALRPIVQKILGHTPPKTAPGGGFFSPPTKDQ